jgi:hypothetical protein
VNIVFEGLNVLSSDKYLKILQQKVVEKEAVKQIKEAKRKKERKKRKKARRVAKSFNVQHNKQPKHRLKDGQEKLSN